MYDLLGSSRVASILRKLNPSSIRANGYKNEKIKIKIKKKKKKKKKKEKNK